MRPLPTGALIAAALALIGCGGPAAPAAESVGPAAPSRLASGLAKVGANLEACFADPPALAGPGEPQAAPGVPGRPAGVNRLVVAIDSSGSMAAKVGGVTKLEAAQRAAAAFLGGVPAGTQIGLVVFGHRGNNAASGKAESCAAVETVYPVGAADAAKVDAAVRSFKAVGWTPLAAAITTAGGAFKPDQRPGAQVIYVVSDGMETCGGDPVAAARALNAGPVRAIVNVIGFDLSAADRAQLKAVADAGGGAFVETSPSRIGLMLDELQRKVGAVSAITRERFDAAGRSTDNNFAVGGYTTKVNMCLYRGTTGETDRVSQALDVQKATPAVREATLAELRGRHEAYRTRAERTAADLQARLAAANGAIDAQTRASGRRLGQTP